MSIPRPGRRRPNPHEQPIEYRGGNLSLTQVSLGLLALAAIIFAAALIGWNWR